jgi:RNAse (barnase) inhibitor barstar
MDLHRLTKIDGPRLHLLVATPEDLSNQARALERKSGKKLAARVVRGRKTATAAALFDECAAALQFPLYFGENWDALNDCLGDLDWLEAESVVLVLADAAHLLSKGTAEEFKRFFDILEQSATHSRNPGGAGRARPYHVILHAAPAEEAALRARCKTAGIQPDFM